MKKVFLDITRMQECTGIFVKDTEVIPAGTTVYSMSVKQKNNEYQKYAEEYDIYFIFDDDIPLSDFYTIPQVDVFAIDSKGGYIGTVGQVTDLESDAEICYIDNDLNCFLIAKNGRDFLEKRSFWKEALVSFDKIRIYDSLKNAMKENTFLECLEEIDFVKKQGED